MSMRTFVPSLILAATMTPLALAAQAHSGSGHEHPAEHGHIHAANHDHADHAAHAAGDPASLPSTPWATDAPLRENMRYVREAVEGLAHYEHGHLSAAQAADLATSIQDAVNAMFTHCTLEAEADAALHGLLATFIAGARAVHTEAQVPSGAIARMREALARYPLMFDDPDWLHEAH